MGEKISLKTYILSRILITIPMIFILLTIVFIVMRALPGDPVSMLEGKDIPEEVLARRRAELGLDKPLYIQYISYISSVLRGDLGVTALEKVPVAQYIAMRLPATVELAISSSIIAILIGVFLGVVASFFKQKYLMPLARIYSSIVFSIPVFYLGLLFQASLGVGIGLFPTGGRVSPLNDIVLSEAPVRTNFVIIDSLLVGRPDIILDFLSHIILPSLTLGIYLSSIFARVTYLSLQEILSQEFVVAARSRGLLDSIIIWRYGVRNVLIPLTTMAGLQIAALLGGAVLTETVFSWPGIGSLVYEGILKRDYALVQGVVTIYAFIVAVTNLLVDIIYAYVDPRVRF